MANTAAVSATALQKDAELLRSETGALQGQLVEALSRFDDVQAQTVSLESEVVDEVCMHSHNPNVLTTMQLSIAIYCDAPLLPIAVAFPKHP